MMSAALTDMPTMAPVRCHHRAAWASPPAQLSTESSAASYIGHEETVCCRVFSSHIFLLCIHCLCPGEGMKLGAHMQASIAAQRLDNRDYHCSTELTVGLLRLLHLQQQEQTQGAVASALGRTCWHECKHAMISMSCIQMGRAYHSRA